MPVYLLGTLHHDRDEGPQKLLACYERIRPTVLLVETCDAELAHKADGIEMLRQQLAPLVTDHAALSQLLDHEFGPKWEYVAAAKYAEATGIDLTLADIYFHDKRAETDAAFRRYLQTTRLFKATGNPLAANAALKWATARAHNNRRYQLLRLRALFTTLLEADDPDVNDGLMRRASRDTMVGPRDAHWEEVIRSLDTTGATVAFAVGAGHILTAPRLGTLYTRIKDLQPIRTLL